MKTLFAAVLAILVCDCTFRPPLLAQASRKFDVIDVHMHAMQPEDFAGPTESANFGAFRKTHHNNEHDPEALLNRTIAEMERNHVSKGVLSGDAEVVSKWVQRYPGRFLPSYNRWS